MTDDQLDKLKTLAERARKYYYAYSPEYIAAISPDVVLGLIAEVRYLQTFSLAKENESLRAENEAQLRERERLQSVINQHENDLFYLRVSEQELRTENEKLKHDIEAKYHHGAVKALEATKAQLLAEIESLRAQLVDVRECLGSTRDRLVERSRELEKAVGQLAEAREAIAWIDNKAKRRAYLEKYPK